jgi:hypothetical protein
MPVASGAAALYNSLVPRRHEVQAGECIASIAFAYGFHPETIWEDGGNAALREQRGGSGYVLEPGDVLMIPDRTAKTSSRTTGRRHRFRRRGVPERLRLQLLADDEPRANLDYTITIDGSPHSGKTDAGGHLMEWIPPNASRASLDLGGGETFALDLGHLLPVITPAGLRARLRNLGYLGDEVDPDAEAALLALALRSFQAAHALPESGTPDDATRATLVEVHGG